jgi:hypothetical protein
VKELSNIRGSLEDIPFPFNRRVPTSFPEFPRGIAEPAIHEMLSL